MYLRRPIKLLSKIKKINTLIDLYDEYLYATGEDKNEIFFEITKNKPLTEDLLRTKYYFVSAPSYKDFHNIEKMREIYLKLHESYDYKMYSLKKSFHPKYCIKDLFFLPSRTINFLLNLNLRLPVAFFLSTISWISTILISTYTSELRELINILIKSITKAI